MQRSSLTVEKDSKEEAETCMLFTTTTQPPTQLELGVGINAIRALETYRYEKHQCIQRDQENLATAPSAEGPDLQRVKQSVNAILSMCGSDRGTLVVNFEKTALQLVHLLRRLGLFAWHTLRRFLEKVPAAFLEAHET